MHVFSYQYSSKDPKNNFKDVTKLSYILKNLIAEKM